MGEVDNPSYSTRVFEIAFTSFLISSLVTSSFALMDKGFPINTFTRIFFYASLIYIPFWYGIKIDYAIFKSKKEIYKLETVITYLMSFTLVILSYCLFIEIFNNISNNPERVLDVIFEKISGSGIYIYFLFGFGTLYLLWSRFYIIRTKKYKIFLFDSVDIGLYLIIVSTLIIRIMPFFEKLSGLISILFSLNLLGVVFLIKIITPILVELCKISPIIFSISSIVMGILLKIIILFLEKLSRMPSIIFAIIWLYALGLSLLYTRSKILKKSFGTYTLNNFLWEFTLLNFFILSSLYF